MMVVVLEADDLAGVAEEPEVAVAGEGGAIHRPRGHGGEREIEGLI